MFIPRLESRMETWRQTHWVGPPLRITKVFMVTHLLLGFSERAPASPAECLGVVLTKQLLHGLDVDLVPLPGSAQSPQVGPSRHLDTQTHEETG